ncbi:MAG: DUF1778 domain-containing protein [Lautropia sp.]|nr:DUF1778 domain-containing protein [Lautropia sp.]
MGISLRLSAEEEALLERAASQLRLSKSEFVRRSITSYAASVIPAEQRAAEIDALYIGQGGGLRDPSEVDNPQKRAVLQRLRKKHGYAG